MRILVGDIETFSEIDLKKVGLYAYAEHESTDLNCFCYMFVTDGAPGPVHCWVPSGDFSLIPTNIDGELHLKPDVPTDLRTHLEAGGEFHAWNAMFERRVLLGPAGRRYNFPQLKITQMRCSMLRARVAGLPGALEEAAEAAGARHKKRVSGVNAMRYLAKPRKNGSRPVFAEEGARFVQLVDYCADDVRAEYAMDEITPPLTDWWLRVYKLDQEINDRGVKVDLAAVDDMEILVGQYKKQLEQKCIEMTGIKPSRPGPLAAWIREHGFPQLENLQADTVRKALLQSMPEECKTVLKIYSTFNMKAVAKFPAMRQSICKDGRLHGMLLICGANTGRFSSTIVQIHNLFRPVVGDAATAIEAAQLWDLDWIRTLYPGVDPMKVFGSCVRGMLIADEGKDLVFPDFSGVEARWNAWMFGEQWKLDAMIAYDEKRGPNSYCVTYGMCFNVDPDSKEGKAGKQIGKVLDLSMGYEGGVGAFIKMAANYKVDLAEMADSTYPTLPRDVVDEAYEAWRYAEEQGRLYELPEKIWVTCEGLKRLWRRAHPRIVKGWQHLIERAKDAVRNPGTVYKIPNGRVMFKVEGRWLVMRLPSGRKIRYFKPELKTDGFRETLYYYGINAVTRQWGRTSTYGGKVCENETQAGCADLLIGSMLDLDEAQYPLVMHVHDEPVAECEKGWGSLEEMGRIMVSRAGPGTIYEGLPLAIEGHRGPRYRK